MTSPAKASILLLWAIIVTMVVPNVPPFAVRAQTNRPEAVADSQKEKEAQELEKKTLVLLNDLASAAWSLKLPENRLLIMSGTADLLWSVDQKRARTVYWDALNAVNLLSSSARSADQ